MWSIFSSYAICSFNHHLLCKMVLSPVTTQKKKKSCGESLTEKVGKLRLK